MSLASELKVLLARHNVHIAFECGSSSDLHGVYEARIEIVDNLTGKPVLSSDLYQYTLSASDIEADA